jgi:hypothetical protein
MKNPNQTLQHEGVAELQAKKAIQRIKQMVEDQYPVLPTVSKFKLILECLIEATEERKFLAAR